MQNQGRVILTSAGFFNPKIMDLVLSLLNHPEEKRVAIITTAAENKQNNKYSILAREQFRKAGFTEVDFIDLETDGSGTVSNYDIIYVCGGNTFKLLRFSRETKFRDAVCLLLKKGGIYLGVSAGGLVAGPSVKIAGEIAADKNVDNITDFSGMNIVNEIIFPHYEPQFEEEIGNFEKSNKVNVIRLTNNQSLLVEKGKVLLIE